MTVFLSLVASIGARLLGFARKRSDAAVARHAIDAAVARHAIDADVTRERIAANAAIARAGMAVGWFWIPWSLAAIPLSAWFAWGVLDSLCDGALPDTAALPPQLKEYADTVWSNIFLAGAGVAGVRTLAGTAGRAALAWLARR